jgi:hypothetical protein
VVSIQVLARAGALAGLFKDQIEQATRQLTRRRRPGGERAEPSVLSTRNPQCLPLDARIALIEDRLSELVPEAERTAVASQLWRVAALGLSCSSRFRRDEALDMEDVL